MEIDSNLLKLYMEIGFMATERGQLEDAKVLFDGIAMLRPKSAYPQIGLGCVSMGYGDFPSAIEILRNAPVRDTVEQELCNGFLSMALGFAGYNDESREILEKIAAEGTNKTAVDMAARMLEESRTPEI